MPNLTSTMANATSHPQKICHSSNNITETTPSIKMKTGDQIPLFSLKFLKIAYNYFASFKLQPDGEKN
jgi:hypothetical protein